ncbi:MAG TPA: DUF1850 domain-containing protein, partial [Thermodesulfobacteriota bacterium]|nr:DUF1850 domain-containing protein [Thermodesulfobacteriota bacterium]
MLEGRPAESGRPVLRRVALPGFRFALRYTHSVLGVPVEERFTVSGRGRLVLEEIRSTDEAIVAYYGL